MGTTSLSRSSRPALPRGFPATLALSMGAGPLSLYALTATAPLVTAGLGISRAQLGSLTTAAFLSAAVASPLLGGCADLFSGRTVLIALFTGAGVALLGTAAAPSYGWLLVAVALSGATQAISNPVTNQLIAAHLPPGRRGRLMGIKQSGVQMSQFGAGLVLPSVALLWGWRGAAVAAVAVAVVGLALVRRSVPADPPRPAVRRRSLADLPPTVWWLTCYALVTGAALQATNVYLPLYSFERLGMSVRAAGLTAAVAGGVGLVARMVWGRATETVRRPRVPLVALAVASGLAACSLLAAEALHAPWLAWVGATAFGASGIAANVVVMLMLMRASPVHAVGTASGILAVGLYLGFAVGPLGFGLIVDHTGSYRTAWLAVIAANALAAALALMRRTRRGTRSDDDGNDGNDPDADPGPRPGKAPGPRPGAPPA